MRVPYAIQGMLFAPALIGLLFVLKAFCPASAGSECFADYFATPVFLPLIAVYKMFGDVLVANGQEFLFILLYWALVGFFLGLVIDVLRHKEAPTPLAAAQATFQARAVRPIPPSSSIVPPPAPAPVLPVMKTAADARKLPLNMLDRPEFMS